MITLRVTMVAIPLIAAMAFAVGKVSRRVLEERDKDDNSVHMGGDSGADRPGKCQCEVLGITLGQGAHDETTDEGKELMTSTDPTDAMIDGPDPMNSICRRVDVIKSTIFKPPTRIDLNILREIEEIGPCAVGTLPALLEEIDFLTEGLALYQDRFPANFEYMDTTRKSNRAVRAMVDSIVGIGSADSAVIESLIAVFDDSVYDGETHAKAARALGLFEVVEALPELKTAAWGNFLGFDMESSDEARVQAALAASRIDDKISIDKVETLMLSILRKYNTGAVEAARALGEIDTPTSRHALVEIVRENPDFESTTIQTREEAARSLGKLKAAEAVGALSRVLADESMNVPVCRAATWALGEIGTPEVIEPLRRALGNGAASVHFAAAKALMKIDKDMALGEIKLVMNFKGSDEQRLEKMAAVDAARALIEIGHPEALDEIERTLMDTNVNRYVRIELYRLLARHTDVSLSLAPTPGFTM